MLINLRNALMAGKRLPYDAEVEFLKGTGTQWIDTGVDAFAWPYLEITCKVNSTYINSEYNHGIIGNSNGGSRWQGIAPSGSSVSFRGYYDTTTISESTTADFITLVFDGPNRMAYAGQSSATLLSGTPAGARYGVWTYVGRNESPIAMSVASVKIGTSRDNLLFDAIPVRKGMVGYLYDRVSGKLFGNAGTGDFVLGPDVVPVECIESHGTEYIDTGTLIEMTDRVDCTFELLAYGNVTLAGGRIDSSTSSWAMWAYTDTRRSIRFDLLSNGHGNVVQSITPTIGREYKVSKIGTSNFVDGVRVNDNASVAYAPVRTCYLFAMNNGGTASFFGNFRIKDFSIGSKLKYRPVRVGTDATSWEGAMMDVLTRRIYRNAGTGAFSYGNDLKYPIPAE